MIIGEDPWEKNSCEFDLGQMHENHYHAFARKKQPKLTASLPDCSN